VTPALAPGQLLGVDGGDVVPDLDLLAEVLARDVHPPLGDAILAGPAIDAALEDGHATVAHPLERAGGQRRPPSRVVTHHDLHAPERDEPSGPRLELAAGDRRGARNVGEVVLAGLAHIDQRERRARLEQMGEGGRSDLSRHQQLSYFPKTYVEIFPVSRS